MKSWITCALRTPLRPAGPSDSKFTIGDVAAAASGEMMSALSSSSESGPTVSETAGAWARDSGVAAPSVVLLEVEQAACTKGVMTTALE